MPASLEVLHKLYRQKMAMLFAVASDSQNLKKVVDSNSKLANLGVWGQDLIDKEGGIHSAVAAKLIDDEAELKMPATPSRNTKTPTNRLASPRLIYDHYSKKYRFTRNETCAESEEWLRQLDESMKKQVCKDECLINSIRSRIFKLPGEPETPLPPSANSRNSGCGSSTSSGRCPRSTHESIESAQESTRRIEQYRLP